MKLKKLLLKLFTAGTAFLLIVYIGFFIYFSYGCNNHYSKQQVNDLIASINKAPVLTDSFYLVYDKLYKGRSETITTRYIKEFWSDGFKLSTPLQSNWQYVVAVSQPYKGFRYMIAPMALAFRINEHATPEKCFDFAMAEQYSWYCNKLKIVDTITNLHDREQIIKFLLCRRDPSYFKKFPAKYKRESDSIKNVLAAKR